MLSHSDIEKSVLRQKISDGVIQYAGNRKLKIYGRLDCSSGKRMKPENRVFFETTEDAIQAGFRPCGNCMRSEYRKWICSAS